MKRVITGCLAILAAASIFAGGLAYQAETVPPNALKNTSVVAETVPPNAFQYAVTYGLTETVPPNA